MAANDLDGLLTGILFPYDQASLDSTGDTLATRWAKVVQAIASRAGVNASVAESDLIAAGFRPDDFELTDLEYCDSIVLGSLGRLSESGAAIYDDLERHQAESREAAMALGQPDCVGLEWLGCMLAAGVGIKGAVALLDGLPRLDADRLVHDADYLMAMHALALLHIGRSEAVH